MSVTENKQCILKRRQLEVLLDDKRIAIDSFTKTRIALCHIDAWNVLKFDHDIFALTINDMASFETLLSKDTVLPFKVKVNVSSDACFTGMKAGKDVD